jgi:hypothetical protein
MEIYVFASQSIPALRGFTTDETGGNLPAAYAPWHPTQGPSPDISRKSHPVVQAVMRDGFFVITTRILKKPRPVPE